MGTVTAAGTRKVRNSARSAEPIRDRADIAERFASTLRRLGASERVIAASRGERKPKR